METKVCSKCGEEKPLTKDYYLFRNDSGKFRNECKLCKKSYNKSQYKKPEVIHIPNMKVCPTCKIEKNNIFFYKNGGRRDGLSVYCSDCEKEKMNKNGVYHHLQEKRSRSRIGNPNILQYQKEYRIKNKGKIKIKKRVFTPFEKMKNSVRRRILHYLKNKSKPTKEIIGCSFTFFREWIEGQFQDGMTWDNYGKYGWHIDHIIPLASATTEEEIYKLNHYTNLQPLWWHENLSKGDKLPKEWLNENTSN